MGSVLMCILMCISISIIIVYITCFKGSITLKGDLAVKYFGYNGILCRLEWMCGLFLDN